MTATVTRDAALAVTTSRLMRAATLALGAVLIAACAFAFVGLNAEGYWTDELFTLFLVNHHGGPAAVWRRALTDTHPPLYYLLMAPIYLLSQGASMEVQQYLLRLAAIPFGLLTVYAAFRATRLLFPSDWFMVITVPAFVAFQPQISYEAAMVNNDIVAIAIFSLLLWGIVAGMKRQFPSRVCLLLGVTLGAGLLVKSTTASIAPVIALAMLWSLGIRDWRRLIARGLLVGVPAALMAAPWYLYLYRTYGDLSGLKRVQELQYWNAPMGTFWELLTDPDFVIGRFRESWGEYGWRIIHFRDGLLWAIAVPMIAGALISMLLVMSLAGRIQPFETPARYLQTYTRGVS